jgi:hypothetical protein
VRHIGQPLIVGVGVNRGDEAAFETERVVEHLGHRSQAVGRAGGVGDDDVLGLEVFVVDPQHHGGVDLILGRDAQHDLLGTRRDVLFQRFAVAKDARGLDDEVDAQLAPGDLGRVALFGHDDLLFVDVDGVFLHTDSLVEAAHHRVVLQQVGQLLVLEQVVDRHDLDVVAVTEDAEDRAPDAAETVDTHPCRHHAASSSNSPKRWIRSTTRFA